MYKNEENRKTNENKERKTRAYKTKQGQILPGFCREGEGGRGGKRIGLPRDDTYRSERVPHDRLSYCWSTITTALEEHGITIRKAV